MTITTFAHGKKYFDITPQLLYNDYRGDYLGYLSFEDALWDFIHHLIKKPQPTLLFPDFFCVDVWDNCKAHGYQVETYQVEENLSVREEVLAAAIERYCPDIVIIFHPLGIPNPLLHSNTLRRYSGWILEDCVHCILDPSQLHFVHAKHIIIDSVRKITPLPGSYIYAQKGVLDYTQSPQTPQTQKNAHQALQFWNQFQRLLDSGDFLYAIDAYNLLNSGDNLIGDSHTSVTIHNTIHYQRTFFNLSFIQQTKYLQYQTYQQVLATILKDDRFVIPINILYPADLAFYPLILKSDYAFLLKEFLLENGIQTFIQFSDCPWAINKNVLCLPLGPHITTQDVATIGLYINQWFAEKNTISPVLGKDHKIC